MKKIGISFLVLSLHPAWAGQFEVPTVEWLAVGLMMLALLIFFGKKSGTSSICLSKFNIETIWHDV